MVKGKTIQNAFLRQDFVSAGFFLYPGYDNNTICIDRHKKTISNYKIIYSEKSRF